MAFQLRYSVIIWVILVGSCNCARQILCDNAGLQWAAFKSGPAGSQYRTFDPNYMKDISIQGGTGESLLLHSSSTTKIGATGCPDARGNVSIYGSPAVIPCNRHTIMLRGYINPSWTGPYAVNLHASDQFGFFWLGPRARSGWHRRNHDLEAVLGAPWPSQRPSYVGSNATFFYLEANAYYPIRMIYANDDGGYAYWATIVDPFGNVILGANTGPSTNVVQYSCDGNIAPDWSPWGKEA